MKINHLSYSDTGGAGIASYRIHKALVKSGNKSQLFVDNYNSKDHSVVTNSNYLYKISTFLKPQLIKPLKKLLVTKNEILHSLNVFPTNWSKKINSSDTDLVHLHWIQNEMISIKDISKIKKPMVMHAHDMWPFCGAEHYNLDRRWVKGYLGNNRPAHESGYDLNKYIWRLKKKHWKKPFQIVAPSKWMAKCVKKVLS